MSLFKSFITISFFTLLSRISGFARDILTAAYLGAGSAMDAWGVAFRLPNSFRRLFAEGAFNAAFIPIISEKLAKEGKEEARSFAERALSFMAFVLLIFIIFMEITMPFVMYGLAPGYHNDTSKFELCIYLTRITFPYLLFISLASLCAGLLNSIGRFAAGSATSIILNLTLMAALVLLDNYTDAPALSLSYGCAIAGILQFSWLMLLCKKEGVGLKLRRPEITPEIKLLLKKMVPGIIGAGVVQINLLVDTIIATLIPSAVSYLYYADRIHQFPLSLIGTAMGTALLPMLARKIRDNKSEEALQTQNRAIEMVLFFALPCSIALIIIPEPIVKLLFERGKFSAEDSTAVSYAIAAFAFGLPAFVMIKIFSTVFFSHGDTKTPLKTAIIAMVLNIIFNLAFLWLLPKINIMPHIGIALATSLSSWVNIAILISLLFSQNKIMLDERVRKRFLSITVSTIIMAAILFGAKIISNDWIEAGHITRLVGVLFIISSGALSYLISAFIFGAIEKDDIKLFLRRGK